jgi:hypothetical protein
LNEEIRKTILAPLAHCSFMAYVPTKGFRRDSLFLGYRGSSGIPLSAILDTILFLLVLPSEFALVVTLPVGSEWHDRLLTEIVVTGFEIVNLFLHSSFDGLKLLLLEDSVANDGDKTDNNNSTNDS